MLLRTLLPLLCFMIFAVSSYAQIEATTSTGDGIILSSDGTWEYKIEDISQSTIMIKSKTKKDVVVAPAAQIEDVVIPEKKVETTSSYILFKNRKSCPFRVEKVGSSYLIHFDILKESQNSKSSFKDLGCVNIDSYAHLRFKDGSTLRLNSLMDNNCTDGIGADITKHLDQLIDKKIELIRFSFTENYVDVKLDESSQIEIPMKITSL